MRAFNVVAIFAASVIAIPAPAPIPDHADVRVNIAVSSPNHALASLKHQDEPQCPAEGEYCGREPKNPRKLWCCPGLRCTSQYDDWPTCRLSATNID
ncbi:hypothetical protein DL98DRAFT_590712 [Cadophora sp. DSE1049]|nr:hypothetical protein DL98DRAFT_590712 [Cadophora sp. DSE1049]